MNDFTYWWTRLTTNRDPTGLQVTNLEGIDIDEAFNEMCKRPRIKTVEGLIEWILHNNNLSVMRLDGLVDY